MIDKIKNILLHISVLFLITIPFWFFNLDIAFSNIFYAPDAGWIFFNNKIVNALYKYGTLPAIIFSIFFIVVLVFQKYFKEKENIRKIAVVFLITLIFAPGIIINVILKNYSGRPRPREITQFNGKWEYRKVLQIGQPGRGYSFPCGHCSMGFIFCSIYFILKNKKKFLAHIALWGGLIYGTVMGLARIAQGAHFLSDVIWAGAITIITAEIIYYFLFEKEKNIIIDFLNNKNISAFTSIVMFFVLIIFLFLFFLMSVPFYKEQKIDLNLKNKNLIFVFNGYGNLKINHTDKNPHITIIASGFGLPKRDFVWNIDKREWDDKTEILFNTFKKGYFKEFTSDITVNALKDSIKDLVINNSEGDIDSSLLNEMSKCILFTKKGNIFFTGDNKIKDLFIKSLNGDIYINLNKNSFVDINTNIIVNALNGKVEIKNESSYFRELNTDAKEITGAKELYLKSKRTGHLYLNINAKKIIIK